MKTNWINGTIAPPESGEYYIIIEALQDTVSVKKGDIEMTSDYYNAPTDQFDTIGNRNNPYWKVLSWAYITTPAIPEDLKGRVKFYFGHKVGENNG